MAINLEDHIIVHSGIEMVPLSLAKKAIEEAVTFNTAEAKLDEVNFALKEAIKLLNDNITKAQDELDD